VIPETLDPSFELLSKDYVLVQAWKKTASHIRYHNWYSDTLELDRATADLPRFVAELAEQLRSPDQWVNDPLRIVPAPKSQRWHVSPKSGQWQPVDSRETATKLRPLAHVSFKDQVAATAVMLCLADRVETQQGSPSKSITEAKHRKQVISYGNRLFCDVTNDELSHRWGSGKLYRAYFQDYRTFLERPGTVAELMSGVAKDGLQVVIVHSDLRQFYDRVSPELLAAKIDSLAMLTDDPGFFDFAHRLLDWNWAEKDRKEVAGYAQRAGLSDFSRVEVFGRSQ